MKRVMAFVLSLALALSLLPGEAFALDLGDATAVGSEAADEEPVAEDAAVADAEEPEEEPVEDAAVDGDASGSCGENLTWELSDDGVLTISGTGDMPNYSSSSNAPWYEGNSVIKSIVIEDGVTNIGDRAFFSCDSLTTVTIPDSVTSIGNAAFGGCDSLTTVTIPDGVTSIGYSAFCSCDSLTTVTIPDGVTAIGINAFGDCACLIRIDFGGSRYQWYTIDIASSAIPEAAVINYGATESGGKLNAYVSWKVTNDGVLTISGTGDMPNYSSSSNAPWYEGNSVIKSIVIEDGVTNIGDWAFLSCDSLTTVTIPDSVTSIGEFAFYHCISLTSMTVPDSLTSIGRYAFYRCISLTSVTIPDGVTAIGINAFGDCACLIRIDFGGSRYQWYAIGGYSSDIPDTATINYSAAESGGKLNAYVSWKVTNDGTLTISGAGAIPNYNYSSYAPWYTGRASIKSIVIEDGVTSIGSYAFRNCSSLTSVTIPDSLTSIGSYAFYLCISLTSVTIPDSVTSIEDGAFEDCSSLTSMTIPDSVTRIGWNTFEGCSSLTSVTIPDSVTYIGSSAFSECDSLTSLIIPDSVTSIGIDVFSGCSSLLKVKVLNPACNIYGSDFTLGDPVVTTICGYNGSTAESYAETYGYLFEALVLETPTVSISCVAASGKPKLSWAAVDGAVKYEVYRSTSKNGTYYRQGTTTGISYTNTGAVAGKSYYYKVRALFSNGMYSDYCTVKNMTCDYARPNVSISTNGETGKPKLTWPAVDGATKYEIWRATSSNGTYSKMYTTANTYYNNTTAVAGKTYYYKVRALGASSYATSAYSTVDYITCDCAQPVVNITTKAATGKPVLSWKAVDGAAKYEVWRAYSKNGTYYKMGTTTGTTYTNTSAKANTTYYYKVKAIGTNTYATSAFSTVKNMTCDCARPSVSIALNANGKPRLSWDAVDGAVKYEIWRSVESSTATYYKYDTTTGTTYTNTSAKSDTTYYYKVRAIGSSSYATSAYSSMMSIICK